MNKTCNDESCLNGYLLVPNHQHDIMERIECIDCLINERYRYDLASKVREMLREGSRERLISIVSDAFADSIYMNEEACADAEDMIQSKRSQDLMAMISVYLSRPYSGRAV
tara:strand:+ start:138 stop:470 length:333 start_codon:yes stop_codon:yes gene_type:complete